MSRFTLGLGASCLLVSTCLCTAADKDKAINYWPLKLGSKWTMPMPDIHPGCTIKFTVTSVTPQADGSSLIDVGYKMNGKDVQDEEYLVSDSEIARSKGGPNGTSVCNPPIPIIKMPMKSGQTWDWNGTITTGSMAIDGTSHFTVSGPFILNCQSGKFAAMKVHSALVLTIGSKVISMPNDIWYSPGIGVIKQKATMNGTVHRYYVSKYTIK